MQNHPNDTVVILNQTAGYLQIDILEVYTQVYKNQVIIAGSITERSTLLPESVKWERIIKYNRSNSLKRMLTWVLGSVQMMFIVLFKYRKAHILAVSNPPFSLFVPWVLKCSYDVLIYDLYPDALIQYGYARKKSYFTNLWINFNRKIFDNAKNIYTLTSGMSCLIGRYLKDTSKIKIVPIWSDSNDFLDIPYDQNLILNQTDSFGKFTIIYSGNLGMTHPVEKLAELSEFLNSDKYSIIIIGEGAKEKKLKSYQAKHQHPHLHLLPWQPVELLSHILSAASLSVVTLGKEASNLSIPSKTFNILSVGNPVLGICDEKSELAKLINESNCGLVNSGKDLYELSCAINKLAENRDVLNLYAKNSRMASLNYTKENAKKFI